MEMGDGILLFFFFPFIIELIVFLHSRIPTTHHTPTYTHTCMPGEPLELRLRIQHAVIGQLFLMRPCRAIPPGPGIQEE